MQGYLGPPILKGRFSITRHHSLSMITKVFKKKSSDLMHKLSNSHALANSTQVWCQDVTNNSKVNRLLDLQTIGLLRLAMDSHDIQVWMKLKKAFQMFGDGELSFRCCKNDHTSYFKIVGGYGGNIIEPLFQPILSKALLAIPAPPSSPRVKPSINPLHLFLVDISFDFGSNWWFGIRESFILSHGTSRPQYCT